MEWIRPGPHERRHEMAMSNEVGVSVAKREGVGIVGLKQVELGSGMTQIRLAYECSEPEKATCLVRCFW